MTAKMLDIELPVVANIEEAEQWALDFESILTVGPRASEVKWGHPNHKVFTFGDTTFGAGAPTISAIEKAVEWGQEQNDLLVHCHAGMSRSTSTAWGISIARGADPLESFLALKDAQPLDGYYYSATKRDERPREFIPNRLIVTHLEVILGVTGLLEIRNEHMTKGFYS
jgi:hypothetical protein